MVNRSMKRNKSMKMGRSMNKSRGRRGGLKDKYGNEIPNGVSTTEVATETPVTTETQPNGVSTTEVAPGMQPGQVQNQVNTGSWMPDFLSSSGDKAKGLLTDLSGETKTLTGDAGSYLKGLMPGSADGSNTPVVSGEKKEGILSSFGFGGGRRRHKSRQLRGGLNQSFGYNAAPVMDSVTSEPTYMIKGGRRRRRSSRRRSCKKRRGCKKSCKRHRHRR